MPNRGAPLPLAELLATTIGKAVLSAVIIELTKEIVQYISSWLRNSRKRDSELMIVAKGNVLKLGEENLEILKGIIENKREAL
jgi:hypothetical protein